MAEPRDDVPLADLEEQQRELDAEQDVEEGDDLPETVLDTSAREADTADVLEQLQPVTENEDYPHGPADEDEG